MQLIHACFLLLSLSGTSACDGAWGARNAAEQVISGAIPFVVAVGLVWPVPTVLASDHQLVRRGKKKSGTGNPPAKKKTRGKRRAQATDDDPETTAVPQDQETSASTQQQSETTHAGVEAPLDDEAGFSRIKLSQERARWSTRARRAGDEKYAILHALASQSAAQDPKLEPGECHAIVTHWGQWHFRTMLAGCIKLGLGGKKTFDANHYVFPPEVWYYTLRKQSRRAAEIQAAQLRLLLGNILEFPTPSRSGEGHARPIRQDWHIDPSVFLGSTDSSALERTIKEMRYIGQVKRSHLHLDFLEHQVIQQLPKKPSGALLVKPDLRPPDVATPIAQRLHDLWKKDIVVPRGFEPSPRWLAMHRAFQGLSLADTQSHEAAAPEADAPP